MLLGGELDPMIDALAEEEHARLLGKA